MFTAPAEYQRTTYQQGTYGRQAPRPGVAQPMPAVPPPPLQSRTGKALKWAVSALLIVALGLGSWQLAEALMDRGTSGDANTSHNTDGDDKGDEHKPTKPMAIEDAREYVAKGEPQAPGDVAKTYDGDSKTFWRTKTYNDGPKLAPYKPGVGIVYDLGSAKDVSAASIALQYGGDHTTVSLYAADSLSPTTSIDSMKSIGTDTTTSTTANIEADKPVKTRYVLLWMTALPKSGSDGYYGAGYKQALTDVKFTG